MRNKISSATIAVILLLACAGLAVGATADSVIVDQKGCKHIGTLKSGKKVTWSGGCVNGFAEGSGSQVWFQDGVESSRYVGSMRAGIRHGKGVFTWESGERYEGDFVDNKRIGKGVFTWEGGERYEGDFVDNKCTGKGVLTWPNGNRYEGDFVDSNRIGKGVFTWKGGERYEGDFVDNKRTGKGVLTWPNGNRYEGDFVNNKRTGKGVYVTKAGVRKEGEFLDGAYVPNLDIKFHKTVSGKAITPPLVEQNQVALKDADNQRHVSADAWGKTAASLSPALEKKSPVVAQPKSWDWQYAYGHPGGQDGKRYLFTVENAEVVFEDPVYYWKPKLGAVKKGERPGVIVYRFGWERPLADARLFIYLPTFHWAYSKGHNKLFGSRDGIDWIELLDVQPPEFGGVNNGTYDQPLPERVLGGNELWLKVELDSYGPKAHQYPVAANTAQLNRYQKGSTADTFRLEVNFSSTTNPALPSFPATQGGTGASRPKGRVLD